MNGFDAGGVKFVADLGAGTFELDTKSYLPADYALNIVDYTDGLVHDVIVQRSADGRNVTMQMYTEGADANQSKVCT